LETDLAISRDGKKLAFTERAEHTRLWSLPFDSATGKIKGAGQPVTPPGVGASSPDISPNGQTLLYTAQRAGKWELWEKSLRDGTETSLSSNGSRMRLRWSPDGSRLAYTQIRVDSHDKAKFARGIVVLSGDGREEQVITTPSFDGASVWDWSADGKSILGGCPGSKPGRRSLCLFPVAAAPHAETEMQVVTSNSEANVYQARFSPDNRWISFCAAKVNDAGVSTIFVVSASGGGWKRITEDKYFDDKPRWSPDGRAIYFVSNRTGFFNVWGIRFDPEKGDPVGEPFRVTNFESPGQMILSDVKVMETALTSDHLILPIMEVSGGIWILENVAQ
jgi:Tol biopolymer transport system component